MLMVCSDDLVEKGPHIDKITSCTACVQCVLTLDQAIYLVCHVPARECLPLQAEHVSIKHHGNVGGNGR